MNMEELYGEMKDALKYLGLSFHQMHLVQVTLQGHCIVFSFGGRAVTLVLPLAE